MQKIIKILFMSLIGLIISLKSSFAILDLEFKGAYTINTDKDYSQEEVGLLFGIEFGLSKYIPIPILSSLMLNADYHNINYKLSDAVPLAKSNMVNVGLNYHVLGIIPFISPYAGFNVSFDFGENLFEGSIFKSTEVNPALHDLYETDLINYSLVLGVKVDGFTSIVPFIPYAEYRRYSMGADFFNAAGDPQGSKNFVVESMMIGIQYRF